MRIFKYSGGFACSAALDSVWAEVRGRSLDEMAGTEPARRIALTLVWFATTLALALFIPDIGVVISYLGALAAIFIFIFPGQLSALVAIFIFIFPDQLSELAAIFRSSYSQVSGPCWRPSLFLYSLVSPVI